MADTVYNKGKYTILNWLASQAIKVILLKSSYTPNADHNFVSDLTPATNELSGTGYSRKSLTGLTAVQDDAGDLAYLDADDVSYTAINAGTIQYVAFFINTGADATSQLIDLIDLGASPFTTNGSDVQLVVGAQGIFKV